MSYLSTNFVLGSSVSLNGPFAAIRYFSRSGERTQRIYLEHSRLRSLGSKTSAFRFGENKFSGSQALQQPPSQLNPISKGLDVLAS